MRLIQPQLTYRADHASTNHASVDNASALAIVPMESRHQELADIG
jgi:hypothetical protein